MTRLLAVLGGMVLLAGCAGAMPPPTADQLATADYGAPISQEEAVVKAAALLRGYLKDPDSARIEWAPVQPGWVRDPGVYGGELRFGYVLAASINAKNSFGGYTGFKPYHFLFFNGELVGAYAQRELRNRYGSTPYMGRIY